MASNELLTSPMQFLSQMEGEVILGLVIVSALLLCTLLISVKKTRRLDKKLARVQQDLKISNTSVINIGQQLLSLEKKMSKQSLRQPKKAAVVEPSTAPAAKPKTFEKALDHALDTSKQSVVDDSESVYDKARLYLAKGDSIENIAKRCNLSHAEVSLLKALNKKPAATF